MGVNDHVDQLVSVVILHAVDAVGPPMLDIVYRKEDDPILRVFSRPCRTLGVFTLDVGCEVFSDSVVSFLMTGSV